jgi:hypothetical protein
MENMIGRVAFASVADGKGMKNTIGMGIHAKDAKL